MINDEQAKKARKARNIVLGILLAVFILTVYFVTIFKMGSQLFL